METWIETKGISGMARSKVLPKKRIGGKGE
jgi:hypothetical protein